MTEASESRERFLPYLAGLFGFLVSIVLDVWWIKGIPRLVQIDATAQTLLTSMPEGKPIPILPMQVFFAVIVLLTHSIFLSWISFMEVRLFLRKATWSTAITGLMGFLFGYGLINWWLKWPVSWLILRDFIFIYSGKDFFQLYFLWLCVLFLPILPAVYAYYQKEISEPRPVSESISWKVFLERYWLFAALVSLVGPLALPVLWRNPRCGFVVKLVISLLVVFATGVIVLSGYSGYQSFEIKVIEGMMLVFWTCVAITGFFEAFFYLGQRVHRSLVKYGILSIVALLMFIILRASYYLAEQILGIT